MKRKRIIFITIILIVSFVIPTYATNMYKGLKVPNLRINGKELKSDVPAIIMDGRTLVPLRLVSEELGAEVDWDEKSMTAIVNMDNKNINQNLNKFEKEIIEYKLLTERTAKFIESNTQILVNSMSRLNNAEYLYEVISMTNQPLDMYYIGIDNVESDIQSIKTTNNSIDTAIKNMRQAEQKLSDKSLGQNNKIFKEIKNNSDSLIEYNKMFNSSFEKYVEMFNKYKNTEKTLKELGFDKIIEEYSKMYNKFNSLYFDMVIE